MKSKAKPVKGSARVQKFDRGGTIGALAGLGTLAYLMRDKFGKGKDKGKPSVEDLEAVGGAGRRPRTIEEQIGPRAEESKGFMSQGKFPSEAGFGTSKGGPDEPEAPVKTTAVKTAPVKSASRVAKLADVAGVSDKPAKTAAKASDKVGKGYEKLDARDTGSAKAIAASAARKTSDTVMSRMAAERDAATKKISDAAETMKGRKVPTIAEQTDTATQKIKDAAAKMKAAKEANAKKPSKPYPEKEAAKNKQSLTREKKPGEVTYLTKERSDAAKKAYYAGFKRDNSLTAAEKAKEAKNKKDYNKESMSTAMGLKRGGSVSSASRRADGIAQRGKTRA
jgi:hypothetical protein